MVGTLGHTDEASCSALAHGLEHVVADVLLQVSSFLYGKMFERRFDAYQ